MIFYPDLSLFTPYKIKALLISVNPLTTIFMFYKI
jgi:hypothetical protein